MATHGPPDQATFLRRFRQRGGVWVGPSAWVGGSKVRDPPPLKICLGWVGQKSRTPPFCCIVAWVGGSKVKDPPFYLHCGLGWLVCGVPFWVASGLPPPPPPMVLRGGGVWVGTSVLGGWVPQRGPDLPPLRNVACSRRKWPLMGTAHCISTSACKSNQGQSSTLSSHSTSGSGIRFKCRGCLSALRRNAKLRLGRGGLLGLGRH